jgi:hypothetical protein
VSGLAAARARAQRLTGERLTSVADAVEASAGIQAQDETAAALSIRVRTRGLTRADVERALVEEPSVVRVWAMRGTIHLVPSEDARWLVELLGPLALAGSHRRLTQLGVPEADRPRAVEAICRALAEHGPLTRAELMEHVASAGVATEGQAGAHLPMLAALHGHVCFGPRAPRGKPTYALRDDWLGPNLPTLPREDALTELARRYARAFAPTTAEDFASWSGLSLRDARAGWVAASGPVEAEPRGSPPDPPDLRLLPAFDTYLLGYRTRDFAVPPAHAKRVWPGGGIVRPAIVANGRAIGTWRRAGEKIEIEPFEGAEPDVHDEVADVRRFLA